MAGSCVASSLADVIEDTTASGSGRVDDRGRGAQRRLAQRRLLVHLGLVFALVLSLALEPVLTLHIVFGLVFVVLVAAHLGQRRRTSKSLLARLRRPLGWPSPGGRLALADAALTAVTAVMLASGFWDWLVGRTTIRWHAISGVLLAVVTTVHTIRRRRRLRSSAVR